MIRTAVERERKFQADPGFLLPVFPGRPLPERTFSSTYYDTEDHRLADAGITLRRRVEARRGLWQLKLPHSFWRLELEAPGGSGTPPSELAGLLPALVRGRTLVPIARLQTRRSGTAVLEGETEVAELTVDLVSVLRSRRLAGRFTEIEAELLVDDPEALARIAARLLAAGARDADQRPKVFQVLGLSAFEPERLPATASDVAHIHTMVRAQHAALLRHDPGTRLGADPEDLHQMRVAARRLRSVLRAGEPLLDEQWVGELRAELAWVGSTLGRVRDLDVMLEHLRTQLGDLDPEEHGAVGPMVGALEIEHASARGALLQDLASERYFSLLERLDRASVSLPVRATTKTLSGIAGKQFRRLRRAGDALPEHPSDDELHRLRILGKRGRYAAELAEPIVGKPAARFVARAKAFQDVLGEHQDSVVLERRISEYGRAAVDTPVAFVAGRLAERQRARRSAARAAFPKAWKRLRKSGARAWS